MGWPHGKNFERARLTQKSRAHSCSACSWGYMDAIGLTANVDGIIEISKGGK